MNELLSMLKIDDLKEDQRELAELIGMDAYLKLVDAYAGTSQIYIPPVRKLVMPIRDVLICREFNGHNIYALAVKWGLSDKTILNITKQKRYEMKKRPISGQISFFDE